MSIKYWFYLEPFTFIKLTSKSALLYNSLNYSKRVFPLSNHLSSILSQLIRKENFYVISLEESLLGQSDVLDFITWVRESFSGDIVRQELSRSKPVILPPTATFSREPHKIEMDDELFVEQDLSEHLNELFIQINGDCQNDCLNCKKYFRQFDSCHKSHSSLNITDIKNIVSTIKHSPCSKIHLVGGNPFLHSEFKEISALFGTLKKQIILHVHIANINIQHVNEWLKNNNRILQVSASFSAWESHSTKLQPFLNNPKIQLNLIIEEQSEFNKFKEISSSCGFIVKLKPFFNSYNIDFFKEFVFTTKDEVLGVNHSKRDIHINQNINAFDYGKLYIMSNGDVYANPNADVLSNIHEAPLFKAIFMEIKKGKSWRRVRQNVKPCKDCVYNFLCQPLSNYEYSLGRNNLCRLD